MRTPSSRLLSILLIISIISLSCTLPFYIGEQEPQETVIYVEVTSAPEDVAAEDEGEETEEAAGATPTVSVSLDGPWIIWYGTGEKQLDIDFLQQGYSTTANAATGGDDSILFRGTISQEGTSVTGTWESTDGNSGNFIMSLDSALSSFSGNFGGGVPFCGVRGSGTKPSTCLE